MKALFEQWLTFKSASLKEISIHTYRSKMTRFFSYFYGRRPETITTEQIAAWMNHELKVRGSLTTTVIGRIRQLREFMEWLVDQGVIPVNPVNARKLPKLKKNRPDKRPFTWEQYHRVMKTIREWPAMPGRDMWLSACTVAWHTGLRRADVAGLAWANVSFDDRCLTVWPQKKDSVKERLTIPIEPDLYDHLLRVHNAKPTAQYVNYDFYANALTFQSYLVGWFRKICDAAGLPDHSFHSFRHGYVTRLLNAGVDPITISSLTGQTLEVIQMYAHVSIEAKMAALERSRTSQVPVEQPKLEVAI